MTTSITGIWLRTCGSKESFRRLAKRRAAQQRSRSQRIRRLQQRNWGRLNDGLVLRRRPVGAVDHEKFHVALTGLQFQAQLLLDGLEDVGIDIRVAPPPHVVMEFSGNPRSVDGGGSDEFG